MPTEIIKKTENINTKEKEELEFLEEWFLLEKYEFKLLTIITVLSNSKRAFRGKLNDLCNELSISTCSKNKDKLKNSLTFLEQNDYIKVIEDKGIYTISLAHAAEKSKNIIKIKKAWYEIIKNADCEASWESLLKVFLTVLELSQDQIYTYSKIGKMTNLSKSTVERCVKSIKKLKFDNIAVRVDLIKAKDSNGEYRTKGQTYTQVYDWSE